MVTIVVLGMHRSGTSMVAGLLHRAGIPMGIRLLESDELNTSGYYEDTSFLHWNKQVFASKKATWSSPPQLELIKELSKIHKREFKALVKRRQEAANGKNWGWKDPRNCFTCWSFHPLVPNVRYLIVTRPKLDIQQSLEKARPDYDVNWSTLIDRYQESVDLFVKRYNPTRHYVEYSELVDRRTYVYPVRNLLRFAGVSIKETEKVVQSIQFRYN